MLLIQHHQEGLLLRLHALGIPSVWHRDFVSMLCSWEAHSGPDWVIKRLKSLKVDLIRQRSNLPPLTWIRKNRNGRIRGVVGSLFRWSEKSDRNFRRTVQAFMAYTFYIHPKLTKAQEEKFLKALSSEECEFPGGFHQEFYSYVERMFQKRVLSLPSVPLIAYKGSSEKRSPLVFGMKSVSQDEQILRDVDLFRTYGGIYLYIKYQRIYDPLLTGLDTQKFLRITADSQRELAHDRFHSDHLGIIGGKIGFLQEPGGKLRSIANPLRVHQEALRPLGSSIYNLVASLPWDCTFDQAKATPFIQARLASGGSVHSVDLTSATDMFPLSLQITALRAIICLEDWDHIDLFEEISRSNWKSTLGVLKWKKGQPLGLYPSFASFTLTHGLLLHFLNNGHNDKFFVVGDDVVILDDSLFEKYIRTLAWMGCPWSPEKSLSSNKLSEFAGKIITDSWTIPQLKWRKMSDDNFLDLCREIGQRSRVLCTRRQQKVFDSVKHLLSPVGLNFSYPGSNLEMMINDTLDFYQPEKQVLGSLMGLRRRIRKNSSETPAQPVLAEELEQMCVAFDEKVISVLDRTIFGRLWTAWECLESIPRQIGITDLPLKDMPPSRVSTLQRYERLLLNQ